MLTIRKAAIIGAGNMGAQIAAHLANVGIPSLLLDIVPTELLPEEQKRGLNLQSPPVRNRITQTLFDKAKKLKPSPLFTPEVASLVRIGNVEDHLAEIKDADWVIEAILERMDLKLAIHAKIAANARPDALVSTNTSGLSIAGMTQGLAMDYRRRFFGTHFFNPPRYMRLLELIPTPDTDRALLQSFAEFGEAILGKGIVMAKDTPGFVANRIGCFDMQHVALLMLEQGLTIDEVDAITGPAIGRPKSATFRLGDIVGVDLMAQMGRNLRGLLQHDPQISVFREVEFIEDMVKRGWWGEKKGQGFYQRVKSEAGRQILTLDYKTMEYHPQQKPQFASLEAASKISNRGERIRSLCAATDKAGVFAWKHLSAVLCYAADRLTEIADDVVTVDNAMKWGYNWELGPFETWDALGVRETADRLKAEGREVPALVHDLLAAGKTSFYEERDARRSYFDLAKRNFIAQVESPKAINLPRLHRANKVVRRNPGASLVDLGDGVACLEFHTKMNVIGGDQLAMLRESLEEVRKNFVGLVIGNQGQHFSAGANLLLLTTQIQNQDWDEIDLMIRTFQKATSTLRQFEKPVVAACHGYTLGGGTELSMGCDHIVIAAETYMGLPEVGVGLIPGAQGTKEMLIRCTEGIIRSEDVDYFPGIRHAWETIGLAKVSTSASEALKLRYLRPSETTIVLNKDWLLGEAKAQVLNMVARGYTPRPQRTDIPAIGESGITLCKLQLHQMRVSGQISEHDQKIGTKLAYILCGGDLTSLHYVSEQYILDLEREVFLSLCGEPKTLERIKHTLKTGKPLRN
ncbi:MAG: 3-hydroxyacyl-CoA dehydrogenase/enoyl-CoA hydratase family protein [Verrucomicrobia bacterium]|nr:3-hydroxyacyl-CoA dehydrogenase/enoyl-CoA hydratase family protein [Verrucomicrobiota bacterium]